jgi:hypothetical protein
MRILRGHEPVLVLVEEFLNIPGIVCCGEGERQQDAGFSRVERVGRYEVVDVVRWFPCVTTPLPTRVERTTIAPAFVAWRAPSSAFLDMDPFPEPATTIPLAPEATAAWKRDAPSSSDRAGRADFEGTTWSCYAKLPVGPVR